jgi:hypothetical protein
VLSITRTSEGLIGAPGEIAVAKSSPIPDVGQRPPDIATDTLATVGGNVSLVTTRRPPGQMHSLSFSQGLASDRSRCCSRLHSSASRAGVAP